MRYHDFSKVCRESEEAKKRGGNNVTGYSNDEVEAILKGGAGSEDVRMENQKRLHAILHRDCPGTFLFSIQSYAAYRVDQLGGVSIHPYRFFTYINSWYYLPDVYDDFEF